jgi:TolB-like protein/class 3 adenylate cyclase/Tfp pilus assembly protein PilF
MSNPATKRRLAAILSADVAGFSRLMGADEVGAHRMLASCRQVMDALIESHRGRIVGTAGDSVLAEFQSVVDAVTCASAVQREIAKINIDLPADRRMLFRIGVNLGDIIVDGDNIFGDGVNVAARLQALAEPGGIRIGATVYQEVRNKLPLAYRSLGTQRVKNIAEPIMVYAVDADGTEGGAGRMLRRRFGRPARLVAAAAVLCAIAAALWWQMPRVMEAFAPADRASATGRAAASGKVTLAVLPFANQSDDPGQDYFTDGLTEDITAALGRFPNLSVMAPNASARYKATTEAPATIGHALGVRYLVEGSIRKAGARMRVSARLIDATSGVQLWSDKYDSELKDVLAVQDAITRRIAGTLAVRLDKIEEARALAKPAESLAAYDYVLQGRAQFARVTRSANREARRLFERAIDLDPHYALAYAMLGGTYDEEARSGWTEFTDDAIAKAEQLARKAIDLDPALPQGHRLLASSYMRRQQYDLALQELDRALQINPSDSESLAMRGAMLVWAGRSAEGAKDLESALSLDPTQELLTFNLGSAYYLMSRYEDAARILERSLAYDRVPLMKAYSQAVLAAAYAQLGRAEEAKRARANALAFYPFFDAASFVEQYKSDGDRERLTRGLQGAGFP